MSILLAVAMLALLALCIFLVWAGRAILPIIDRPEPVADPEDLVTGIHDLVILVAENRLEINNLKIAVSDGIDRVHRAESRIQKTVRGAHRKLAEFGIEHAALEAEFEALPDPDDETSEPEQLQIVPEEVADPPRARRPISQAERVQELKERRNV